MNAPTAEELARLEEHRTRWLTTLRDRQAIEDEYREMVAIYELSEADDWSQYKTFAEVIGVDINLEPAIRFDLHEPDEQMTA